MLPPLPQDIQKVVFSYVGHPTGTIMKNHLSQMQFFQRDILLQTLDKVSSQPFMCDVRIRYDYQYIYLEYEKIKMKSLLEKDGDQETIQSLRAYIHHKIKYQKSIHDFEMEDEYEIEDIRHSMWKRHGIMVGKDWARNHYNSY